jgi:hypothetical protein
VIIQPSLDVPTLAATNNALSEALQDLAARYSAADLALLQDFAQRLVGVLRAETERLEAASGGGPRKSERASG